SLVSRVRKFTDAPVAVGFGVSTPEHVKEVWSHADGAVVGSRIVSEIADRAGSPDLVQKVGALARHLRCEPA
ncbi:MAG TPA: tryptophan synthase subunit alpha, partial [Blastocatellia bacterium]|nr:tryptophan synthase subunit alpha [Blastocatellia bacterium]